MIRTALLASLLLALAACGSSAPPPPDNTKAATPAPEQKQKTVFDDQLKAIDKAKSVEKTLQQEKEQHDRTLEQQERGD